MNAAQFHFAMDPQMKALHIPWSMEKAEQVLQTFYTKFLEVQMFLIERTLFEL